MDKQKQEKAAELARDFAAKCKERSRNNDGSICFKEDSLAHMIYKVIELWEST